MPIYLFIIYYARRKQIKLLTVLCHSKCKSVLPYTTLIQMFRQRWRDVVNHCLCRRDRSVYDSTPSTA